MEYSEFIGYILENIGAYLPDQEDMEITVSKVEKNNGITLDGLNIKKEGDTLCPTIYLNAYYERLLEGDSIDNILKEITYCHQENLSDIPFLEEDFSDFDSVKDLIFYRIINYEWNLDLLKQIPHIKFQDLALTFRWLAHRDDIGIATALIKNRDLILWNIEPEELFQRAVLNTPILFPPVITNLCDMISHEVSLVNEQDDQPPLYVLTNEHGINGASCIYYKNILKKFASKLKSNLYILPSSVHEVILLPVSHENNLNSLIEMVQEANEMILEPGEVLSDQVYCYDYKKDEIIVAKEINS